VRTADEKKPEAAPAEEYSPQEHYVFPSIRPVIRLSAGYRLTGLDGSPRAEEYEYLHSSPTAALSVEAYPFPHRLHIDLDFKNRKDYFADIGYAYEDLVLFRGINRTLFHNLDAVTLIDGDPSTASPGVSIDRKSVV